MSRRGCTGYLLFATRKEPGARYEWDLFFAGLDSHRSGSTVQYLDLFKLESSALDFENAMKDLIKMYCQIHSTSAAW